MTDIVALDRAFAGAHPLGRMKALRASVEGRIVFTTSFGVEDQLLTDLIFANDLDIEVVTLDTGRLFPETYKVWSDTELKYGKRIRAFYPDASALEALIADQGVDGFYYGVDMRKACCGVRKVEPLKRALAGASAWVTGLRADQSANRAATAFVALKATVAATSIMAAEKMWKHGNRIGAIGVMVASNVAMGFVAANNARVLASGR